MMAATALAADPLAIDLTRQGPASSPLHLNQGTSRDPQGHELTTDSQSLLLDGNPWVQVTGEFHYARSPRAEWRDELLKMKAGGCTAVSTYVIWIYHEEERGRFEWTGDRALRDFLLLAQEVGLKVVLRIGPWAHAEVRNGGFPDWVRDSHTLVRTTDAAYLDLVRPYYKQVAEQTKGLYWKDGGPIFAIQVDNECDQPDYLLALKALAREDGIDAPFYTMTGWGGVPIPKQDLLPLFGAYAWGLWKTGPFPESFVFGLGRNNKDMGANLPVVPGAVAPPSVRTPYLCAENGGGMQSSYNHRVYVQPDDVAAINLVRLGNGNTMPGFYMYQGGVNPDGKLSHLNEEGGHPLPVKDYDFFAPLGAFGQVRGHYHLLREQNLFLQDFGAGLIRMPAFMPAAGPRTPTDTGAVRWIVRWKDGSGFLFFNNHVPELPMPDHPGVQFALQAAPAASGEAPLRVPAEPVTIPADSYGIWPINLDCGGARLLYATAQPLCRADDGADRWYFFMALPGIDPDFVFARHGLRLAAGTEEPGAADTLRLRHLAPGTGEAFALAKEDGSRVHFVLLTREQAGTLWRAPFAGKDRVILAKATVLGDQGKLRLQGEADGDFGCAIFPAVGPLRADGAAIKGVADGVFERFAPPVPPAAKLPEITAELVHPASADALAGLVPGSDEKAWPGAALWKLHIPAEAQGRRLLLSIHYAADAARLSAGDALLDDNFWDAQPFDFGLWRVPPEKQSDLTLQILPYTDKMLPYLPNSIRQRLLALGSPERDAVTVSAVELREVSLAPDAAP